MKKITIILILLLLIPTFSFATNQIVEEQLEALNIGLFIAEGEKYTKENFPDINIKDLITKSLTRRY